MSMLKVKALMTQSPIGFLATTDGKKTSVRPMSAWLWDGDDLISASHRQAEKVAELGKCAGAEYCFSAPDGEHVRIAGTVSVADDPAGRKKLHAAHPPLQQMFRGPDDPELAVLRMKVRSVRLFSMKARGYTEVLS